MEWLNMFIDNLVLGWLFFFSFGVTVPQNVSPCSFKTLHGIKHTITLVLTDFTTKISHSENV